MTLHMTRDDEVRPSFPLLREMVVERGDNADWALLHHLHYKTEGRPFGPKYWRLRLHDETIGVIVLGSPKGMLKERHKVFPWIKPGGDTLLSNRSRYKWANEHITVIARLVLDTRFRSVGAAYRFQNLVSRMSGRQLVEIQSSMSKYNLFAARAGFRFAEPMRSNKFEQGVRFFRETFESHPADIEAILAEIARMPAAIRRMTLEETRRFYYANSAKEKTGGAGKTGRERVAKMEPRELIRQLQQLVLASPLYAGYVNPDWGRALPDNLPLTAFDRQPTDAPLVLENDA